MRLIRLLLILALAMPGLAMAQSFDLPGLNRDAGTYQQEMQRRFPAGVAPAARIAAEQRAREAEARRDFAAAATAWEERIGMRQVNGDQWLALALAQLGRTPPENQRALQAAWRAFQLAPWGEPEVPALIAIAEALRRLNRPVQQIEALETILERSDTPANREALAAARRAAGMLVRRVTTEPEAEPARACLAFTNAPARRTDWLPQDWIRADPPIANLAIEREGDLLCVAGLPWGASTRLILRAGLPGEDRQNLRQDTAIGIAMPNRDARIAFDTRAFILPRGQEPRVSVATVNVTSLTMRVVRVAERNLVPLRRDWTPGEAIDILAAGTITEDMGRILWEGRAELQRVRAQPHASQRPAAARCAAQCRPGRLHDVLRDAEDRREPHRTAPRCPSSSPTSA